LSDPSQLADVVFEGKPLPKKVQIRAFRDGMIAFDFASWGEKPAEGLGEGGPDSADAHGRYQTERARLINAYVACLSSAGHGTVSSQLVAPSELMLTTFEDGAFKNVGITRRGYFLAEARHAPLPPVDSRLLRDPHAVKTDLLEDANEQLRYLMKRPDPAKTLLRTELLLRASVALNEHSYGDALVHAWTATEVLIRARLAEYLKEHEDRPVDGGGKFINRDRRDRLLKGKETAIYTATEILSLADWLPFDLYRRTNDARKLRNDWLHDAKEPLGGDVGLAILTAQQIFALVEGIELHIPVRRALHSIGE
jgi:hypothetical protein